jgi:hypothetical protein
MTNKATSNPPIKIDFLFFILLSPFFTDVAGVPPTCTNLIWRVLYACEKLVGKLCVSLSASALNDY